MIHRPCSLEIQIEVFGMVLGGAGRVDRGGADPQAAGGRALGSVPGVAPGSAAGCAGTSKNSNPGYTIPLV